jgi:pimeloyl-ACP methyl ester carboxylesterase
VTGSRFERLEVLAQAPTGAALSRPLLFIHGAFTGAWCWQERFLPFFADAGYSSYAVSLSGHGKSRGRERLDSLSIADYVDDVAEVAARLTQPPVLIGHSMGGFVVQKYLESHATAGAVLLCSVPPQGLAAAAMGMMLAKPGLLVDLNRIMAGSNVALDALREALFAQPVADEDLGRYYRWSQPESHRAIWDMTLFNLPRPALVGQSPMLVLGAEYDHLIPRSLVELTARAYGVEAEIFAGLGHGVMLEAGWRPVAQRILDWLGSLP